MFVLALASMSLVVRPSAPFVVRPTMQHTSSIAAVAVPDFQALSTAQLKRELIDKCFAFRKAQEARWEQEEAAGVSGDADGVRTAKTDERLKSPLAAEGFSNVEVDTDTVLETIRNDTIGIIQALSRQNPTPEPFAGWRSRDPAIASQNPLDGTWRLLFTTGADATFRKTKEQGEATASQEISARRGHFVNCVDFSAEDAKLRGFRVVVAGYPLSTTEVQLKFRRVKLLRRSRWLKTVIIPLPPSRLLRALSRWASRGKGQLSRRGAGFELLYLDDEMRMHLTFDGQYFVQMRPEAYEAAQKANDAATASVVAGEAVGEASSRGGAPRMGFADWGKGEKVARARHVLVKDRRVAEALKEQIEAGELSFTDAAKQHSVCGSAAEGGALGAFRPGEMVAEFDAYCFDPATTIGAIGVVETEFGAHLIELESQSLGVAEGKSQQVKTRRMLDSVDPNTGLRS